MAERRGKTVNKPGKKAIIDALTNADGKIDGFTAAVFGRYYEALLHYHFDRQKSTVKTYHVWRAAGEAWAVPNRRKVRQDYLLESVAEAGSGARGGMLTCFEAKSWPGYQKFRVLTKDNVGAFLKETQKFIGYLKLPADKWVVRLEGGQVEVRRPDRFGFLVFDYEENDRDEILKAFSEAHRDLLELESITGLLSMILLNDGVKDEALAQKLRDGQLAVQKLTELFLRKE